MLYRFLALVVLYLGMGSNAMVQAAVRYDPSLVWHTLHTPHFAIHYHDDARPLANRVASIAEDAHERLSRVFQWEPKGVTQVVVSDRIDIANGMATPVPSNRMVLYVTPPDNFGSIEYDDWLELLIEHEYTHIVHIDKAGGLPRQLRQVFGRNPLLFPGGMQPTWFIEGLATYMETHVDQGVGRGQSSDFEMYMRMEVLGGIKPLRQVNQPTRAWPGGMVPYLYGVHFYNFVTERWGPERIETLVSEYSDNLLPYLISYNAKQVLGKGLPEVWQDFSDHLSARYGAQLRAIEATGLAEGERLTEEGYNTGEFLQAAADGTLYYIRRNAKRDPGLMRLRPNGRPELLAPVEGGAVFDLHPRAGIVVAQLTLNANTNIFYDLFHLDPASGEIRRLTRGGRYRMAAWNPNGDRLAAVQARLGRYSLQLLDAEGQVLETWWQGGQGVVVSGLDWSPDGSELVAAVLRPGRGWELERFIIGERRWERLTEDAAVQGSPRYTVDGRAVLFSADYGGVYNIHRLNLQDGQIETLTNVRGGAFSPAVDGQGNLYYAGCTPEGFDVFRLGVPSPRPLAASPRAASPETAPASVEVGADWAVEPYRPLRHLRPSWWMPVWYLDAYRSQFGFITSGSDPLGRHGYAGEAGYDAFNGLPYGSAAYVYDRWYPAAIVSAQQDHLFELLTTGEVGRIRRSQALGAELLFPLYGMRQRWALRTGFVRRIEADAWRENGVPAGADLEDNVLGVNLAYDSTRRYLRSYSRAHGRDVLFTVEDSALLGGDYDGQVMVLDWREFVSTGREGVLALRAVGAWSRGVTRPYRLGGALGQAGARTMVQPVGGTTPFNRRAYPLRGYPEGLADLRGRRMVLGSAEWRLPLARVERGLMIPPVALQQLSVALFGDAGAAGERPTDPLVGVGAELHTEMTLFYRFESHLRLGYAQGLDAGGVNQIYITLGTSF